MSVNVFSAVRLLDAKLLAAQVVVHSDEKGEEQRLDYSFSYEKSDERIDEERPAYRCQLQVGMITSEEDGPEAEPSVSVSVTYGGFIDAPVSDKMSEEAFERVIRDNAFSLLYGIIRGKIQDLTALTPQGAVVLPGVVPATLLDALEEKANGGQEDK